MEDVNACRMWSVHYFEGGFEASDEEGALLSMERTGGDRGDDCRDGMAASVKDDYGGSDGGRFPDDSGGG
jgi:hypothetical protein